MIDSSEPLPRPEWIARRVVHKRTSEGLIVQWMFTLVVWTATLGMAAVLWWDPNPKGGAGPVATLVLFSAGGLLFLYTSIIETRRRARFRSSVFELDSSSFTVGACVSGTLVAPPGAASAEAFKFVLHCFEIHALTGSSAERSLWREEVSIPADRLKRRDGNILVPIAMMTPVTARPTCDEVGQRIKWRLSVTARTPGLDYVADFELPVFPVKEALSGPSQLFPPGRPEVASEPVREAIRSMRAVVVGLVLGLSFLAGLGLLVGPLSVWGSRMAAVSRLMVAAFGTLAAGGYFVLRGAMFRDLSACAVQLRQASNPASLVVVRYRPFLLAGGGLIEGPGLMAGIAYLASHDAYALAAVGAAIVLLLAHLPSEASLGRLAQAAAAQT